MKSNRIAVALALVFACACGRNDNTKGLNPAPTGGVDNDMERVLTRYLELGPQPLSALRPDAARQQPTMADAVRAELIRQGKSTEPEEVGSVENRTIPGSEGAADLPIRVYTPSDEEKQYPVIVYFHGGGWVIGTIDTYDSSARALANAAKAVVVSVEYRKGPEHPFPAAHDDALAAYSWVLQNVSSFKGDIARVALAGESAGGNLAVATAMQARDLGLRPPVHVLAVYPIADGDTESPSYEQHADAVPLSRSAMQWFFGHYAPQSTARDPRISLVRANLANLPPTTLILAEVDPLRSDGEELRDRLKDANVTVGSEVWNGSTHEFFGLGAVVSDARDAVEYASDQLKSSFGNAE